MRRLLALASLVPLIAAAGALAQDDLEKQAPQRTSMQAARSAARDWLAPLVRPDLKRVTIRVAYCRDRGKWDGCRVHITGVTRCNGVLQVQVLSTDYHAWMPRMRCR